MPESRLDRWRAEQLTMRVSRPEAWDVTTVGETLRVPEIWRLSLGPVQSAWTLALWPHVARSDRLHSHGPLTVGTELEVVVDTADTDSGINAPGAWLLGRIIDVQRVR